MGFSFEPSAVVVRSLDVDFHELTWEVENQSLDPYDFTFQVLRSESPEGPFEPISVPFQDQYRFIDNVLQTAHRWRVYHYKLRVTHRPDGEQRDFGPYSGLPEPDLIAMEVRRHIELLMQEFAGRRMWVLPVRTFGQRCDCWSHALQRRTRSGCRRCFDTGFVRGYWAPIEIWGQIDPSPKTNQVLNVGSTQQSNTTGRMGHYPGLKPDDVIVEAENRRWKVSKVGSTEKGRATLHQELELREIQAKDIEFTIPLEMDRALKDLFITPARNFSNPHTLEAAERDVVDNLFGYYAQRHR